MRLNSESLHKILVLPGHVSEDQFQKIKQEAESSKKEIEDLLISQDLIKDDQLGQLIALEFGFNFINLGKETINAETLDLVPEPVARSLGIIAFSEDQDHIKIGMLDPKDLEARHLIEKKSGKKALVYYITKTDFANAMSKYEANIKIAFNKILKQMQSKGLSREKKDETIVQIVDMMLLYGYQNKASDIHIEPYRDKVLARFRIDGVMHDVLDIPRQLSELIITRIKIMAKMRTDEHRAAMDGKLKFKHQNEEIDVRVSTVPVTGGENVVMRLLSSKSNQYGLTDLGMNEKDLDKVRRAINNPHGMIVVTGPTGSGKTTTVYAVMKILNTRDVHISSIEDPVEYDIEGISQIQVNPKTDLTFAKGLKAIVRQDPDIIMIGEVRDEETADIAVNSAMTGHLVLTTLHANDSATTLPRFLDMGVEPYLVASTMNVIIAQRLVREICSKCRMSFKINEETQKLIERNPFVKEALKNRKGEKWREIYIYKGAGCSVCHQTGSIGRVGVFEVMEMDEELKDLITKRAASDVIQKLAKEHGMTTILEDGIDKVLNGITTIEEVIRVTKE